MSVIQNIFVTHWSHLIVWRWFRRTGCWIKCRTSWTMTLDHSIMHCSYITAPLVTDWYRLSAAQNTTGNLSRRWSSIFLIHLLPDDRLMAVTLVSWLPLPICGIILLLGTNHWTLLSPWNFLIYRFLYLLHFFTLSIPLLFNPLIKT